MFFSAVTFAQSPTPAKAGTKTEEKCDKKADGKACCKDAKTCDKKADGKCSKMSGKASDKKAATEKK